MEKEHLNPLFSNPMEPYPGLSVDDLNRYLPAIRKADEIVMTLDTMEEGLFLADALEGLKRLPEKSIDLILTAPPVSPWRDIGTQGQKMTLQEYYTWNNKWLQESQRVLKNTGAIYLLCGWRFSGMYHALLSDYFRVQTRITWRDRKAREKTLEPTWFNEIGDIWLATKTGDFIFDREMITNDNKADDSQTSENMSNLWLEYFTSSSEQEKGDLPEKLLEKILKASSFKLSWVVDPFMRKGSVGVAAKNKGRRFIGFETDQDNLLVSMKRIDQS
jgi:site-specific DNA-methyltransferase (adenine-specific)|tara:strand:+ start:1879 stop:2700 length:822 start_codon:yes stop_codon:yes gene_type:complete